MKITCIIGSARNNGSTAYLIDKFIEGTDGKAEKPVKGIAIAVRAGVSQPENELILNSIAHYFGHLGIETVKRISILETDTLSDLIEKHQNEIEEIKLLGKTLTT